MTPSFGRSSALSQLETADGLRRINCGEANVIFHEWNLFPDVGERAVGNDLPVF